MGGSKDVSALVQSLEEREISWCMIGGLAVNHWAEEPMATADVDLVIVTKQLDAAVEAFQSLGFSREEFAHSVNLKGQSKVSIQITTAEFYQEFPSRAVPADVHGMLMRVPVSARKILLISLDCSSRTRICNNLFQPKFSQNSFFNTLITQTFTLDT